MTSQSAKTAMSRPRYRRRKEARPDEIADAAFDTFAEHGYAGARVDEVARRAGVSKGLLYLYFKTKEELFKAVIMRVITPRMDRLVDRLESSDQTAEALLRGAVREFMTELPDSRARIVLKLMISDGSKHPDLVDFYWQHVASRGLEMLRLIVNRGVASGEFRKTAIDAHPQLIFAPALVAAVWNIVFADRKLDTGALIDTHVDMLLSYLKQPETAS